MAQAQAVIQENHLTNMACSCQSFVTNVELNTLCLRLNIVVNVERNGFNIIHNTPYKLYMIFYSDTCIKSLSCHSVAAAVALSFKYF